MQKTKATAEQGITLAVKITYLWHEKPRRVDPQVTRARKATASAKARAHEGRRTLEYPRPIRRWTARDVLRVIDQIRDVMPTECPDEEYGVRHAFTAPADRYRRDGRALQHLRYRTHPHRLWFSTAAGFAATIRLPAPLPAGALVRFIERTEGFVGTLDIDAKATRGRRRRESRDSSTFEPSAAVSHEPKRRRDMKSASATPQSRRDGHRENSMAPSSKRMQDAGEDAAGAAWERGVAREWSAELADPRGDLYTLDDGERVDESV